MEFSARAFFHLLPVLAYLSVASCDDDRCPNSGMTPYFGSAFGSGSASGSGSGSGSGGQVISCNDLRSSDEEDIGFALNYYCRNVFTPPPSCEAVVACDVPSYSSYNFCASDLLLACSIQPEISFLGSLYRDACSYAASVCLDGPLTGICSSRNLVSICYALDSIPAYCDCFVPNATCELCEAVMQLCQDFSGDNTTASCDSLLDSEVGTAYTFLCQRLPADGVCPYSSNVCQFCSYLSFCDNLPRIDFSEFCELSTLVFACSYNSSLLPYICPAISTCSSGFNCPESGSGFFSGGGSGFSGSASGDICATLRGGAYIGHVFLCQTFEEECPYSADTCAICSYINVFCNNLPQYRVSDLCGDPGLYYACSNPYTLPQSEYYSEICPFLYSTCYDGGSGGSGSGSGSGDICATLRVGAYIGRVFLCQTFEEECPYSAKTCAICSYINVFCNNLPQYGVSDLCGDPGLYYACSNPYTLPQSEYYSEICPFLYSTCYDGGSGGSGSGSGSGYDSGYGSGYSGSSSSGYGSGYGSGYSGYRSGYGSGYSGYRSGYGSGYSGYRSGYGSGSSSSSSGYDSGYGSGGSGSGSGFLSFCSEIESYPGLVYYCLSSGNCSSSPTLCDYCQMVYACPDITLPSQRDVCSNSDSIIACICDGEEYSSYCSIIVSLCLADGSSGVCEADELVNGCSQLTSGYLPCQGAASEVCNICSEVVQLCALQPSVSIEPPLATTSTVVQTVPSRSVVVSTSPAEPSPSTTSLATRPPTTSTPVDLTTNTLSVTAPSSTSTVLVAPSSSVQPPPSSEPPVVPSPSPVPTKFPEGTSVEVDKLEEEQEENTVNVEFQGISVAGFLEKERAFRQSVADAVNKELAGTDQRRRKRNDKELTADDVKFVGRPITTDDGSLLIAFFAQFPDSSGVVDGTELANAVNNNMDEISDATGGSIGTVRTGVPDALRPPGTDAPPGGGDGGGLSGGAIAAIVIVLIIVAVVVVIVVVGAIVLVQRRKRKFELITGPDDYHDIDGTYHTDSFSQEGEGRGRKSSSEARPFPLKPSSNDYTPVSTSDTAVANPEITGEGPMKEDEENDSDTPKKSTDGDPAKDTHL